MGTAHDMLTTRKAVAPAGGSTAAAARMTRGLLACGVALAPVFIGSLVVQMLIRPGYDIRRQPLSLLTLGDLGWVQVATFVVSGLCGLACAVGVRRTLRHGPAAAWGPPLLGLFGLALVAAGTFVPDPSMGFPPGAPQGVPAGMSWHSVLHGVAFFTAFTSLVVLCVLFARRFAGLGRRGWTAHCVVTAVVAPVLVAVGMTHPSVAGIPFAVAGAIAFGWVSALAAGLLAGVSAGPE